MKTENKERIILVALSAIALGAILFERGFRVIIKDGVLLALQPELAVRLQDIEAVHSATVGRGMIVTAGSEGESGDGEHKATSKHYLGLAIDVRTKDLTQSQANKLLAALKVKLGDKFFCQFEGANTPGASAQHIHIQYNG